ncbi:16S rRNA methyltransferase [archaeon]|nr:16S rRNA methyltransferase [archaeon]|tara:strand:- start:162 stop:740 length:579 start_codon:yes stop_codon:yes gene_type:complete
MSHYFSEKQESELKLKKIKEILNNREYEFYTASGVFSKKKLDFGTKVLIKNMQIKNTDNVLDLGCGIGVVGKIAAQTAKKVILTDINKRAVKLAKLNTKNKKNITVLHGNMFEKIKEKFTVILLNPPQTAGKKICFQMIEDSKKHLEKNGSLQLVARHNKGGKTLSEYMEKVFGNLKTLVKQGGYRVYLSTA